MSQEADALAVGRRFIDLLNKGELAQVGRLFADDVVVVDDVAPFRWKGAIAAEEWLRRVDGVRRRLNASIELNDHDRVKLWEGGAYIVVPGSLRMGGAHGEFTTPGLLTLTLGRVESEWLVNTVVWSTTD